MKYFDYAATCPLDEEAVQVYVKASTEYYGNSSSLHDIGDQSKNLLENCRRELALLLGVLPEGIYFTSGGSEGNFLAIRALISASAKKGKHIITGMAEHSSLQSTMDQLIQDGYRVTALPLNSTGHFDLGDVKNAIQEDTVLISIQHANPEIGTIQPIQEIGSICKENDILFHSDCVQSFGKVDFTQIAKCVDSLTISGHKFYGPKGIGALYIHPRLSWSPFYPGATHEKGLRPGTVNVPAIAAMTVAAQKAYNQLDDHNEHFKMLRESFLHSIEPLTSHCIVYHSELPSTIGLRVKGIEGQFMMLGCNRYGFAISTGSACQVGLQSPSKTMIALGLVEKEAKEFIRISFGRDTTKEDTVQLGLTILKIFREFPPIKSKEIQ